MSTAAEFASLSGRVACVTGSSSGIGRAIALELARAGAHVVAHYGANEQGAEETARQIRQMGRTADILQANLTDFDPEDVASQVWSLAGEVAIWVNNAGADILTGPGRGLSFVEKLEELLAVDVRACMLLCKAVGGRMKAAGNGVILNIGWDQAQTGMEGESGELFSASKNAVMGFTRSLALSLAPEVRVNCIAPGWIQTAWGKSAGSMWQRRVLRETPLKRWGRPEDIAALTRFLVSDEAGYITGQVINANGGAVR